MIKYEPTLVTLTSAALIATAIRLFFYLSGSNDGSYLRESIKSMGVTVILLEVCVVMLRFFSTLNIVNLLKTYISSKYDMLLFIFTGVSITFLWTTLPGLIIDAPKYKNDALIYLANRPFEPVPIVVEYLSLYLLHNKIISTQTSLTTLCISIIAVVIAISDVKGNGNTIFQVLQSRSSVPIETSQQEFRIYPHTHPEALENRSPCF